MKRHLARHVVFAAAAACAVWSPVSLAALAQRTFVASSGNDANTCSVTFPCRQFSAALAQTADGGEIIVLNSAGYGTVLITQSVSIVAPPGIYGGMTVISGDGVTIAGAGIDVRLRGLTINGIGASAVTGINVTDAARVTITDCTVSSMTGSAIGIFAPSSDVTVANTTVRGGNQGILKFGGGPLTVVDSRFMVTGSVAIFVLAGDTTVAGTLVASSRDDGIDLGAGGGVTRIAISDSVISGSALNGINVAGGTADASKAEIVGNTIAHNGYNGILAIDGGGATVVAAAKGNLIFNNTLADNTAAGIQSNGPGAQVRVSGNSIFGNATGVIEIATGHLYSPGDNYVHDNGVDNGGHSLDTKL